MPDRPDEFDRRSGSAVERPLRPGNRTAAAGREFLKAFSGDLGALAAPLRRFLIVAPRVTADFFVAARTTASSAAVRATASSARNGWPLVRGLVRGLVLGIVPVCIGGALIAACAMLWALHGLPIDGPAHPQPKPTLLLEAADGTPLGRVGPLKFAEAPLHAFPPILVNAVLSIEDRRFYKDFGVDPLGILRAARADRRAGKIVEGGSGITQQLVKRVYLDDDERTYTRKLREALLAIWLEFRMSKEAILTRYLNVVYLGDGAYGMEAAARLYFDKPPADLTLPEAALLAGLIQAPSALDPVHHLEAAQARAATVLDAMVANGVIDAATAAAAKAHPATIKDSRQMVQAGSWYTDWVAKPAADLVGGRSGSVRVRTTLEPRLQQLAQQVIDQALEREGRQLHASEGALVAMRPDGAVLAVVGGRDYGESQFNRAVDAQRPPGSAFKLFTYLAALRQGYTPQDTIDGGPIDIKGWKPENFDDEQYGRITLADAFAKSVNTAAVRLAMQVGLDKVIGAARDLGLDAPLKPIPSLTLGTAGVSLINLTGAFASVRADRMRVQPWGVSATGPADGPQTWAAPTQVMSAKTLDPYDKPLLDLLQGVVKNGTGRGAALDGFTAGKTGTSQDYRDAWFIGFNDRLVVGVWVGNDDDSPMNRVVGGTLPASIWKQFMTEAAALPGGNGMQVATSSASGATEDAGNPPSQSSEDQSALPGSSADSAPSWCNVKACNSNYHSFRASDCTYQPWSGPRRICEPGDSTPAQDARTPQAPSDASNAVIAAAPGQCDVAACARNYSSFRASDCTYQPFGAGSRQRCDRPFATTSRAAREPRQAEEAPMSDDDDQ
jgi:penicillin-binding protein 1A